MEDRQAGKGQVPAPCKILILRAGAIGDGLLTFPAILALRRMHPACRLTLYCRPDLHGVLFQSGLADECESIDDRVIARLCVRDGLEEADIVSLRSYSRIINFVHDPDSVMAQNLLHRVGVNYLGVNPLPENEHYASTLLDRVVHGADSAPVVDDLVRLFKTGFPPGPTAIRKPYGVIHPGSGSRTKNWPLDRFMEIAQRLMKGGRLRVVWLLGEADVEIANVICSHPGEVLTVRGKPLNEVAALLVGASVYMGNDSGMSHLASLCGVPGLALFGPSKASTWGPLVGRQVLVRPLSGESADMGAISVEDVWDRLSQIRLMAQNLQDS